jgi:ribosomal protein S1
MKQATSQGNAAGRRLHQGDVVRVKVIQISGDSVFVDAGMPGDGRIQRSDVLDENDEPFVKPGDVLEATVVDPRPDGPRFSVSRRAYLDQQRRAAHEAAAARVVPGAELEGTVSGFNRHGAVIDLDGLEAFVHLSELAWRRVERAEDAVQLGERVRARVLSIDESDRGPRVRLSLRALLAPEPIAKPAPEEVLRAKVVASVAGGVTVTTPKGEGFIRHAELGLPPGADHRRAFPQGKELDVVLVTNAGGRLRFSATQVARVEERKNFRDYSSGGTGGPAGFGQLGDLLRERLGLPPADPDAPPPPAPAPAAAAPTPVEAPRPVQTAKPETSSPRPQAAPSGKPAVKAQPPRDEPPAGVIRRRRPE